MKSNHQEDPDLATMSMIPYSEITSLSLYPLGNRDNEIDSHVKIIHQDSMRGNVPYPGGIYDDHMGSTSNEWGCGTCKHGKQLCPGHFGSVYLNYPVISPMYNKEVIKWLKVICFNCGKLIVPYEKLPVPKPKILTEYVKLATRTVNRNLKCPTCSAVHAHITRDKSDPVTIYMEVPTPTGPARHPLYPHLVKTVLDKILDETVLQMGKPLISHPRKFIIDVLRAPPNTIRPDIKKISGGRSNSNDLTVLLATIIKINEDMPGTIPNIIDQDLSIKIHNINLAVHDFIRGSSSTTKRSIVNNSKKPLMSVAKRLPRKYGRIRRNLMGRRASNMARSFITCDITLYPDEVGIPTSVAKRIQIPEVVRDFNYDRLLIFFMNGTTRYPGCTKIKKGHNGRTYYVDKVERLEIGDTVYRDFITGDSVPFNRQPSLEASSISAMRIVVMPMGETFRINISACPFFNADFDGDAMNLVFPRTNRTMNEVRELSSPNQFFIAYKDGSPKIGEAQDGLIGIAELTRSSVRLDKYHAMQIFSKIRVYPDFSKWPKDHIFTGRELVTILLKESGCLVNYTGTANIYQENQIAFRKYNPDDIRVEIDRGELKSGVLDKRCVGEGATGGLFHIIHNQYGPKTALKAAFDIQQMALAYLNHIGVTVSLSDVLLKPEAIHNIHTIEQSLIAESKQITDDLNNGKIIPPIGKTITEYYEELQINALNPGDAYWEHILGSIDPEYNNLYRMIMTGSRGKLNNFKNIASAIGQLEINGERMKENFGGRTLAYFTKYDSNPGARGYISNSYLTGMTVAEFIFHAQETRYALINKALSTSITGTYNRMAVKNMESSVVDNQFKTSNAGKIVQLVYGGDAADPRFIENVRFPIARKDLNDAQFEQEFRARINMFDKIYQNEQNEKLLDEEFEQLRQDRQFYRDIFLGLEMSAKKIYKDSAIMPVNINRIIEDTIYNLELKKYPPVTLNPGAIVIKVRSLCNSIHYCLINEIQERTDAPIPPHIKNNLSLMCVLIRSYLNCATLLRKAISEIALDIIITHIRNTYTRSLIDYGKTVGIIAAQSISEPMTQMVLDSHHNSGASSTKKKGMFRIKEIIGARSTKRMKAPSMNINVRPEFRKNKPKVQEIANHIEMLPLRRFINNWQIFFEKYGQSIHPTYKHENAVVQEFERYNVHVKVPTDLANWCIRMELSKSELIAKHMKMETIYHKIRQTFPATHIVYSSDNDANIIMRIYVRTNFTKKSQITIALVTELVNDILDTVIRGVRGIRAAYVQETPVTETKPDGSLVAENNYFIFTDGTNMEEVLENPLIDPDTTQSDSILEMYEMCGITAARQKIINELKHQVEGSSHRHYTMYADVMTYTGVVTSIDRYGSSARNSNILLRISDASPLAVIENAAVDNQFDTLEGISGPVMVGKNPEIGDLYNGFELNEDFIAKHVKSTRSLLEAI